MLLVIAHAQARPDRREELVGLLAATARRARREPGCLTYAFNADIEDPTVFRSVEEWDSAASFDQHMGTPELAELLGALPDLLTGDPTITVHQVSSTAPYGS